MAESNLISVNLSGLNDLGVLTTSGMGAVAIQITGTWSGTVSFEGTANSASYSALNATPPNSTTAVTSTTSNGLWIANIPGLSQVRARMSSFASGSAQVVLRNALASPGSTVSATISGGNSAASATGSAVPTDAGYTGVNIGGTLRGVTGVNYTGTSYAADTNVAAIAGAIPQQLDYDTGAGTATQTIFGLALPASGGPVAGGTSTNPIRVDPTGTTTQPISAASLPLPTGAATAALQTQPGVDIGDVTVNNASGASAVNIQDGGNSITVDNGGTFAVQATVAAAATNIAKAEDAASADADVGVPAMAIRKATPANTSGTDGDYEMLQMSAGRLWVDPSGVTLTVASHAVTNAGTFAVQAACAGDTAHDAADTGNPVKVGFKAETSPKGITLVADGDRTDGYADADGMQMTKLNTSFGDIISERVSDTGGSSTAFSNFTAVANTRNYVTALTVYNTSATAGYVDIRDGTGGSILWTMPLPAGGGSVISAAMPLFKSSANTALAYDVSAALTTVYISMSGFQSKA